MSSVLINEGGSPIIDESGNFKMLDDELAMLQRIMNVMLTQKTSEPLNLEYGFDLKRFMEVTNPTNRNLMLRNLVAEAFNPRLVYNMQSLDGVTTSINEDGSANVSIDLTDTAGRVYISNNITLEN